MTYFQNLLRAAALGAAAFLMLAPASPARAQRGSRERDQATPRTSPEFLAAFRGTTTEAARSTVRILCDGKEVALGTVVGPDGWILTKYSLLSGQVSCRLKDGPPLAAKIVGVHEPFDLAMLKVEATGLVPVKLVPSKVAAVGSWLVSVGQGAEPVAVGVLSVATRTPPVVGSRGDGRRPNGAARSTAYLGVTVTADGSAVKVVQVLPESAAAKAGLKVDDRILSFQGTAVTDEDALRALVGKMKPGDVVTVKLARDGKEMELKVTLANVPTPVSLGITVTPDGAGVKVTRVRSQSSAARAGVKVDDRILAVQGTAVADQDALTALLAKMKPGDQVTIKLVRDGKEMEVKVAVEQRGPRGRLDQNLMGSELSERRTGFPTYFQSDTVIKPKDCGGPVCDLDGRVLGINIARAGRVESYAIPTEALTPLLADLMSGQLLPKTVLLEQKVTQLKAALKKAEDSRAAAAKRVQEAQEALKKQEADKTEAEKQLKAAQEALGKAKREAEDRQRSSRG
jgi:serine protease Do